MMQEPLLRPRLPWRLPIAALWRVSVRNALRHRVRHGLLALSVAASAFIVVLAFSVGKGIREQLVRRLVTLEGGAVTVSLRDTILVGSARTLEDVSDRATAALTATSGIRRVRGRTVFRGTIVVGGRTDNVQFVGLDTVAERSLRDAVMIGPAAAAAPDAADAVPVAISESVARQTGASLGAACVLYAATREGTLNLTDCVVGWVYHSASRFSGSAVYARGDALAALYGITRPTELLADVDDLAMTDRVVTSVRTALQDEIRHQHVRVQGYQERAGLAAGIARANTIYLLVMGGCVLLLAAIGLATAVLNGLRERQRELGTLLALGWTGRALFSLAVTEMAVVSVPSAAGGALAGVFASALAASAGMDVGESAAFAFGMRTLRPEVSLAAAVISVAACVTVCLLSAGLAARGAARVNIVRALEGR